MESWLSTLGLALGLASRKQKKSEQERQKFLSERRNDLGTAFSTLAEITTCLILECGPIGLDPDFMEDVKLAPFYAMGEVLSAQGEVFPEQETVLKIMFSNIDPVYNYTQFTEAVIHRTGIYQEYWDVVGLKQEKCGSLWLTLFELIYRSRKLETFQHLSDQLLLMVWHFSYLGDPNAPFAESICHRITESLNHHINAYQQTPYIHALMLLQCKLLEMRELAIEEHFLLRDECFSKDDCNYYGFSVYDKNLNSFYGKFAVKELNSVNGVLDPLGRDEILIWDDETDDYELFYEESV